MTNLDLLLIKQKITIQIHMRKIEKPELISTIRDKKKVWLNIRESRLMYMFHRKLISVEEYEAGSRFVSNTDVKNISNLQLELGV